MPAATSARRAINDAIDSLCAVADAIDPHATKNGESDDPIAHWLTLTALQLNAIERHMTGPEQWTTSAARLDALEARRIYPT